MSEGALSAPPPQARRTKARVLVSDLHLGEGRRSWDGSLNTMEDFTVDQRFVEFIDYYSNAYDEVELILAGNFFEMLRCRAVEDYPDVLFETYAVELLRLEMEGHPQVIQALKRFMEDPRHELAYVVGEADVGMLWPGAQEEFKKQVSDRVRFYSNDYFFDGIYVQHGHQYDAMHAMDVSQPFKELNGVRVLKLPWGAFFYANFIQPLRRIRPQFYRVRPMRLYLMWACLFETRYFFRVIWQFIKMLVLASSKHLYPGTSLKDIPKIFSQAADSEALEKYAEVLLMNDAVQKVIFGHAHIANYRQFKSSKEYFNAGTWTRNLSLDMRSLGSFHRLTYVLIEYRGNPSVPQAKLMEWRGKHEIVEDYD